MNALETLSNITTTNLISANLRYCLVTPAKLPIKIDGVSARPNHEEDFVDLEALVTCDSLDKYAGVGISIQASKICAIDVDHCFSNAFDITSVDNRAKDILTRFKDVAYCEFSFSGKGLRVLFKHDIISDYSLTYYIKNEKQQVEFYQPSNSFRYVTITGRSIYDNVIDDIPDYVLQEFLDDYMKKPEQKTHMSSTPDVETRTYEQLLIQVKRLYLKSFQFQNLWFGQAPGSGSNESELDYQLIAQLYEHVTKDHDLLKQLFEASPYFKSKDYKHIYKWKNQNGRYYEYVYSVIRRTHQ